MKNITSNFQSLTHFILTFRNSNIKIKLDSRVILLEIYSLQPIISFHLFFLPVFLLIIRFKCSVTLIFLKTLTIRLDYVW